MNTVNLVFDAGGTKTRIGIADGDKILKHEDFLTPTSFLEWLKIFKEKSESFLDGRELKVVSGGVAGMFYGKKLFYSPNLSGWIGRSPDEELRNIFGCEILIENDAVLAGLGEAVYGAGKDKKIVAYITVSTGVGGARIVNGKIDEKVYGFEPGQTIVDVDEVETLEEIVSGSAVSRKTGRHPSEINDKIFWDDIARKLAFGLHKIIMLWSPDVVVLGGGMILKSPGIRTDSVNNHLREISKIFPKLPEIRKSEIGDLNGLYGALAYANDYSKKQ